MSSRVVVPFFINQRGCRQRCVYCAQTAINGESGALPSAAEIRETVAAYRATAGGRCVEVAFYGGSFTCLPRQVQQQLLEPAAELLRTGTIAGIRLSTRPDAVGAVEAAFLADHGVGTVELGVQSLVDEVLQAAGRGHAAAVVPAAVTALRAAGCRVGIQLMPGLPQDAPAQTLATLRGALALKPDFLRIYPTVVLANTPLAALYGSGEYIPWHLDQTVAVVKRMLHAAMWAGVPVLRIGLQPSASLDRPGAVVAGPYHPALGELVQAALWRDLLAQMVSGTTRGPVELRCAPRRVSAVVGQKRSTLTWLAAQTNGAVVRIVGDPVCGPTQLILNTPDAQRTGDLLKDLTYDDLN